MAQQKKPARVETSKLDVSQHTEEVQPMHGEVEAQNDIADVLYSLANWLKFWPAAADFLRGLADWFENLNSDQQEFVVARLGSISDCSAELLDQVKFDVQEAATALVVKTPERLRDYLNCLLETEPSAQTVVARSAVVKCAMDALFSFLRTRNWQQAATEFVICLMSSIGGGGGNTPTTPAPGGGGGGFPVPGFKQVKRC